MGIYARLHHQRGKQPFYSALPFIPSAHERTIYGGIFVNNHMMKKAALACAWMMLLTGGAQAEEKRLGDYVYVPAISVPGNVGTISLRVEGMTLGAQSDEPVRVDSLAGAEFGVYVFSEDGELTPWANPLYPSEQMRIRTAEGMTSFSLPEGIEFYLRQESAPQGYLYNEEALIRVQGDEIVVTNWMPGELVLCAADSLGQPIAGVTMQAVGEDGETHTAVTDENGEAVIRCAQAGLFAVQETALPQDAFAALRVLVNDEETTQATVQTALSARTRVVFEHPASGSIELSVQRVEIDENGDTTSAPLSGVTMEILGETAQTITTDENGVATLSLLEGLYDVRFAANGEEELALSHTQGQVQIQSGAHTKIELTAAPLSGRIVVNGLCEKDTQGGSVSFEALDGGAVYGPYAFDEAGTAVTEVLPAGEYRIAQLIAPDNTRCGDMIYAGNAYEAAPAAMTVAPGQATQIDVKLLTMEKQTFSLYAEQIDEQGEIVQTPLEETIQLALLDANGEQVAEITAEDGMAQIEALSGQYTLRMDAAQAEHIGISAQSEPFMLPGDEDAIAFGASGARLILMSVDENGEMVSGAIYSVMDSAGTETVVQMDAEGQGVTPLLAAGEVRIESVQSPANHDEAQRMTVTATAGEATIVQIAHPSYGTAQIGAYVQGVDERGAAVLTALPDAGIRLFRVEADGQTLAEMGENLTSMADGTLNVSLQPGHYVAQIDVQTLPQGYTEGESVAFEVLNTQRTQVQLTCMDAQGAMLIMLTGSALSDEEMAQVRFEATGEDGQVFPLRLTEGAFYVGDLPAGSYTLRQTQIPQGYTLAKDAQVTIQGGVATQVAVPLEEYAVVTVSKTGITFNDRMQTYLVPLTGEYGVYVREEGEMKPYPSEQEQMTVWANVTPEQIAQGRTAQLRLPAAVDGTTYYLREMGGAAGFAADMDAHEVTLHAGETAEISCTVSSDRGFFSFSQTDAATGEHVPGGEFELIDNATGETVLTFTLSGESYRNAMAVPVGSYTLRQLRAGDGYAMSETAECDIIIEPYLTQGGTVTQAATTCARIPETAELNAIGDLYAAQQEGLTLLMVEGGTIAPGETLRKPQMTIRIGAETGARTDIGSVLLSGVTDAQGSRYIARVEYCLKGGGWQPSDARMTDELSAPVCISLMDVEDDITAVRITYMDANTGEEKVYGGFTPGQVSLNAEIGASGETAMIAEATFIGETVYTTQRGGQLHALARSAQRTLRFAAQGNGEFTTVSAGRDGGMSGVVFFDENADGVLDASEQQRYAGMTVSLLTPSLDVVATCRTDGNGRYAFSGISGGEYVLRFDAGDKLVFSAGEGYSDHVISGIADKQYGVSGLLRFDGDHTDYVVNAGCIYAASASGLFMEKTADGTLQGYAGLNVEFMAANGQDEEPSVVMTDDNGAFTLSRILPGEYDVTISLAQGYLCDQAENGAIKKRISLAQGEMLDLGEFVLMRKASVSGCVYIDSNGDGALAQETQRMSGANVTLLRHRDGHTEAVVQTTTDENGCYVFDDLVDGEYSVLFELNENWTFTRFGQDSKVYGAVSSMGSTQSFVLMSDMQLEQINAGATLPAQLEVFVFADEHGDGQKGTYDVGLAGVTLTLIRQENGSDAEQISLTTAENGLVRFEGLAPGEYVLAYQMPGIYRATKQVESDLYETSCVPQTTLSTGRSEPFTLAMGESNARKVIGAMLTGTISGTVYYDNDADARIGEDEPACENALVELLNASGEVVDTRYSDENGAYAFEGLAPGRYSVRFSVEGDCGFSGSERSMTRGGVQKSDASTSQTRVLTVAARSNLNTADAGVVRLAAVEGTIFVDRSANRVMDGAEAALAGVSVHLMNGSARNILMSTVTDEAGHYSFDRLTPGDYLIRIDAPQGYAFSGAAVGNPLTLGEERDGRGYSTAFELLGGAQATGLDFGLLMPASISGRVWIDADYDGFAGETEAGMRGAIVTLMDANGAVVAEKTTIRSGEFFFEDLLPGEYTISVALNEGYVFTAGGGDSLMDRSDSQSASLYLGKIEMGAAKENILIGAIAPASVSGVVWMDADNDGRRVDGDAGVSGVMVSLTRTSGMDSGKTISVETDASGAYRFDGVMPGEAQIRFELSDGYAFAKNVVGDRRVSCVPVADSTSGQSAVFSIDSGASVSGMDAGILPVGVIDGKVWEDAAYDGKIGQDERGIAGARVSLLNAADGTEVATTTTDENGAYAIGFVRPGAYMLSFELPNGMIFTCDGDGAVGMTDASVAKTDAFDVAMGQSMSGINAGAIVPASIRGSVNVDANENGLCDENESGLSDAVITIMQGGTIVTSERTNADGVFEIDSLRPGTYRVRVALPEDALFAHGTTLALASADAQEGETAEFTLTMGEATEMQPVPVVQTATVSGRAWLDTNADGWMDANEPAMTDVTAQLLDESFKVVAKTKVAEDGTYRFERLRSGTYAIEFTLSADVLFADQIAADGGSCVPPVKGSSSVSALFEVGQGDQIDQMNVGGILPGSIGDTVFLDSNGNGLMDYREPQIAGVTLELLRVAQDGTMEKTAETVSDEYGYYVFSDLRPGNYVLRVVLDEGDELTKHIGAPLQEIDSDVHPETGETDPIFLSSGQTLRNVDIGFLHR